MCVYKNIYQEDKKQSVDKVETIAAIIEKSDSKSGMTSRERTSRRGSPRSSRKKVVEVTYEASEEFDFEVDGSGYLYVDYLDEKGKAKAHGVMRGMCLTRVNGFKVGEGKSPDSFIAGCREVLITFNLYWPNFVQALWSLMHFCSGGGDESMDSYEISKIEASGRKLNQNTEDESDSSSDSSSG
eukprot:928362-Amorphochlora_amoeboformis.AAC.1